MMKISYRFLIFFVCWVIVLLSTCHVITGQEEQGLVIVPEPELTIPEGFDPYKILNVEHSASRAEIKKAYKKITLLSTTERTKESTELAFKILGNAKERKKYDDKMGIIGGGVEEL